MSESMRETCDRLSEGIVRALSRHVDENASYVMTDYPLYSNVGDHAIWIGAKILLKNLSGTDSLRDFIASRYPPCTSGKIPDSDLIIMNGGGNFGTLYPKLHEMRLKWIEKYRDRKIVQLPQTIFFDDTGDMLYRTCKIIERHGNFVFMARDRRSHDFARKHFPCESVLAPDAAFGLHGVLGDCNGRRPIEEVRFMLRGDVESLGYRKPESRDWTRKTLFLSFLRKIEGFVPEAASGPYRSLLNVFSRRRLAFGKHVLCDGTVVVSDRLHVHILCLLLGIPHVMLDNTYGKVSSFMKTWNTIGDHSRLAGSMEEAVEMAASMRDAR